MNKKRNKWSFQLHDLNFFAPTAILLILFGAYPLAIIVWHKSYQMSGSVFLAGAATFLVSAVVIFLLYKYRMESPIPIPGNEKMWRLGHTWLMIGSVLFVAPIVITLLFIATTGNEAYSLFFAWEIPFGILAFIFWYIGGAQVKKSGQWLNPRG